MQIRAPPNIDLICGLVLILYVGLCCFAPDPVRPSEDFSTYFVEIYVNS